MYTYIHTNIQAICVHTHTYIWYGSLNVIGPHNLVGSGSSTIRWCGFVEVGMALLEKVCHCGGEL